MVWGKLTLRCLWKWGESLSQRVTDLGWVGGGGGGDKTFAYTRTLAYAL